MNAILAGLLFAAAFLAVSANEELAKQFMEMGKACFEEQGINPADIEKFKGGKISDIPENFKCALHCTMKKAGAMDEAGKLKPEAIKAMLTTDEEKKQFEEGYEKCKDLATSNPCETAIQVFRCMKDNRQ